MCERRLVTRPSRLTAEMTDQARRDLGLFETATTDEIDQSYRCLALRFHPDRCRGSEEPESVKRFQEITNAYLLVKGLVRRYRYSLRPADVRRDQEDAELKHLRQFGFGLWPDEDEPLPADLTHGTSLRGQIRITAENVEWARRLLKLPELTTAAQLRRRYHTLAVRRHPDRQHPRDRPRATLRFAQMERAYQLLSTLLSSYRYSFRLDDLRRDQAEVMDHPIRFGDRAKPV